MYLVKNVGKKTAREKCLMYENASTELKIYNKRFVIFAIFKKLSDNSPVRNYPLRYL